jgi:hypothetical protein
MNRRKFVTALTATGLGVKAAPITSECRLANALGVPAVGPMNHNLDVYKLGFEIVHRNPDAPRLAGTFTFRENKLQTIIDEET